MIYGYARVSKEEQNLDLQLHALTAYGCDHIFIDDGISAVSEKRDDFNALLATIAPLDEVVVWKNDRMFRSLEQAVLTLKLFRSVNVKFCSLTEYIDTATPFGRAMFYMLNVFAELERENICERTQAGLEVARRKGKTLGRRHKLAPENVELARQQLSIGAASLLQIAQGFGVSPRTLSRALRQD